MAEFLFARPEHRADIIDFINYVFSQTKCPHDFKTLIPKVYADGRGYESEHAVAMENGRVRGVVALLPIDTRVAGQKLKIGYIGSVSTYPYGRGTGYMKTLMNMQIDRAVETGIDIMMLGGNRKRYEYFGFSPCGTAYVYDITAPDVKHGLRDVDEGGITFIPMDEASPDNLDAARQLYERGPLAGARPRADFACICGTWYYQPRIAKADGAVIGYLIASPDNAKISEIEAMDGQAVSRMLKAWYVQNGVKALKVVVPGFHRALSRALAAYAGDYIITTCQQVRIVNLKNVLRAYLSLAAATAPLEDGAVSIAMNDDPPVRAAVHNGVVTVENAEGEADIRLPRLEMQQYLFSVNRDMAPDIPCPVRWFPLPLYLPQADNF